MNKERELTILEIQENIDRAESELASGRPYIGDWYSAAGGYADHLRVKINGWRWLLAERQKEAAEVTK